MAENATAYHAEPSGGILGLLFFVRPYRFEHLILFACQVFCLFAFKTTQTTYTYLLCVNFVKVINLPNCVVYRIFNVQYQHIDHMPCFYDNYHLSQPDYLNH